MTFFEKLKLEPFLKPFVFALAVFTLASLKLPAQDNGLGSPFSQDKRLNTIDSIIREWFDDDGPGGVVLVVQNGQPVFCQPYGLASIEHNVPIKTSTVFNVASLDKQFIAFTLALLVVEGRVSLDDDIHRYLPTLPDYGNPVTIRQLVDHTSGLPDEFSLFQMAGYWTDDVITIDQVFELLKAQSHLLSQPGEKWQYCNSGYSLIIKVIEKVTGEKFSDYCQRRIFKPLKMTNTILSDDHRILIKNRADSYEYTDAGYTYITVQYRPCLYTTATDLVKWIDNFDSMYVGDNEVMELMLQPGILNDGALTDYAFGQFVKQRNGHMTYYHSGHVGAYTSFLVRIPDRHLAVAILSNAGYFRATSVGLEIADLFLSQNGEVESDADEMGEEVIPSFAEKTSVDSTAFDPGEASLYSGLYQLQTTLKILKVQHDSSSMSLIYLSDEPLQLIPDIDGKFRMEGVGTKLSFNKDNSGNVTGLNLHMGLQTIIGNKVRAVTLEKSQIMRIIGDYYARELLTVCSIAWNGSIIVVQHPRYSPNLLTATDSLNFVGEHKWLRTLNFNIGSDGKTAGFYGGSSFARNIWFQKIN